MGGGLNESSESLFPGGVVVILSSAVYAVKANEMSGEVGKKVRKSHTLSANGTEPSLGLPLSPGPLRDHRHISSSRGSTLSSGCRSSAVASSDGSSIRLCLLMRQNTSSTKLNHVDRTFTARDQMSAGQQYHLPRRAETQHAFGRGRVVLVVRRVRRVRSWLSGGRWSGGRCEAVDLLKAEDVLSNEGLPLDHFDQPGVLGG